MVPYIDENCGGDIHYINDMGHIIPPFRYIAHKFNWKKLLIFT